MKKSNQIIHLLVALFFGISLVFFLAFNSLKSGFGMQELQPGTVVSFLLIGLILFLTAWATGTAVRKNLEKEISQKEVEKNELKAKIYDMEQGSKLKIIERKFEQQEDDKESSSIKPRQNF
jgi:large-conductance mechanosensitive channel